MPTAVVAQTAAVQIARYNEQFIVLLEGITEERVWRDGPGGSNAIGTLALHLAGNLKHYLGAGVSEDGYVRDRPSEFADRGVPKVELIKGLQEAVAVAGRALESIDDAKAASPHTTPCGRSFDSLADHVSMLACHFAYHVGQANYAARGS